MDLREIWHKIGCFDIFQFKSENIFTSIRGGERWWGGFSLFSPHITGPGLNNIVEKCPQRTGAHPHPEAAETEHEGEGSEDVDPEVDDDDHREDVDGSVTVVAVSSAHPDRSRDQPADLEKDVDWNREE